MGKPFKMKYTNGKKADASSFPFKTESPKPGDSPAEFNWGKALKGAATGFMVGGPVGALAGGAISGFAGRKKNIKEKVQEKVDEKIEEKVDQGVEQEVNEASGKSPSTGYIDARL